jgi:hypothetical protein
MALRNRLPQERPKTQIAMPPPLEPRPLTNAVNSAQQAAGPIKATMAVAHQPAASYSRRGIRRHVGTRRRERAAASATGQKAAMERSHGRPRRAT